MKQSVAFKAELHKAKVRIAKPQSELMKRRLELWVKLKPLVKHPEDRKILEMALRGKNLTPRYW